MKFIIKHALAFQSMISKLDDMDAAMVKLENGEISEEDLEKKMIDDIAEISSKLLKMLPIRKRLEIIEEFK